jgi:hypothetical protein
MAYSLMGNTFYNIKLDQVVKAIITIIIDVKILIIDIDLATAKKLYSSLIKLLLQVISVLTIIISFASKLSCDCNVTVITN